LNELSNNEEKKRILAYVKIYVKYGCLLKYIVF